MVRSLSPDIVSVTVPPKLHAPISIGVAETDIVDAIVCEKPMAMSYTGAEQMTQVCRSHDVQLCFNHQRRFAGPFRTAKALLDDGAIGDLKQITVTWGDLFDVGSHAIDLATYLNNEHAAQWVLAQLDYRDEDVRFGVHTENQALAQWHYENGVYGLLSTGAGGQFVDPKFDLIGTQGTIQIDVPEGPMLRVDRGDGVWEPVECDPEIHGSGLMYDSIGDAIAALQENRSSELRAENAIKTAAILFGAYESVRERQRIDLPPTGVADHPLQSMVEAGVITPNSNQTSE
jgi:predicted dehydrogenase